MDDLRQVLGTWRALQPFRRADTCRACECLQGALAELRLTLEELPASPERDRALGEIREAQAVGELHGCRGCEPCDPGDLLADFYRARNASAANPAGRD